MSVKRYRDATVSDALRAVREELGPDALITETSLVAARGWRGWLGLREVQVTAEGDAPEIEVAVQPDRDVSVRRTSAGDRRCADTSIREGLVARLVASGLDRKFAESVAESMPPAECRGASAPALRRAIAAELSSLVADDAERARVEVFVGPPGVGKTTTIAKIAAQERVRRGHTLGMVAADAFRAGAIEQLRAYANIIGAPFRIARTAEELDKALAGGRQRLLVDTAGRSASDAAVRDTLRLIGRHRGVRTHLVLAADTSAASARRIFDAYRDARPDRLVITKLDEAETISPLLGVIGERQIPISFLTAGQRVPEDLDRATPDLLAAAVLRDRQSPYAWIS